MPTPDEEQRALVAVRAGADDQTAADYAGINVVELYTDPFAVDVERAKSDLAMYATTVIRQAMGSNPALAQRYLDRVSSEREVRQLGAIAEGDNW